MPKLSIGDLRGMIGNAYGSWYVLQFLKYDTHGQSNSKDYFFKCECLCGDIKIIGRQRLISPKMRPTNCGKCNENNEKKAHK